MMEYAAKIENGRKKAANKLNAKLKEIKATKGKTPTPVRLKEKFSFVDIKGKKREFVRKFAYDRALAKNKALREEMAKPTWSERARMKRYERGQPFNMKTPQNVRNAIKGGKNMKFVGGSKGFKTVTPKAKTPTPKAKWSNANNKQFMELLAREKNAQRKLANKMNKARPLKNGPLDPAVAYAHNTPHPKFRLAINKYVNSLTNNERNILKKKIC
jgi:hypothetical protein